MTKFQKFTKIASSEVFVNDVMLDGQLCQVGGWFFRTLIVHFGEKSKTNTLIILSYQMHLHF